MKRYTIIQFRKDYPDDNACLDKIFKLRYSGITCPKCDNDKPFNRVKDRRSYQCPCCGFQVYPTAGTIFEKTTIPLSQWFYTIYLQTTTRNGVAAKELERQLNICYKTALRMSHQIKILMADKSNEQLLGIVETDETFIGGKAEFMHTSRKKKLTKTANGLSHMIPLLAMLQRDGNIKTQIIPEVNKKTLYPPMQEHISKDATLVTDGLGAYNEIGNNFKKHKSVSHATGNYVRGDWHTNTVEGFFSQLKRTIKGTHVQVSKKHLHKYVDEVVFRYTHRKQQDVMFDTILSRLAS